MGAERAQWASRVDREFRQIQGLLRMLINSLFILIL